MTVSWATWTQFTYSRPINLQSILILSSHLRLNLRIFSYLHVFLLNSYRRTHMCYMTRQSHHNFTALIKLVESYKLQSSLCEFVHQVAGRNFVQDKLQTYVKHIYLETCKEGNVEILGLCSCTLIPTRSVLTVVKTAEHWFLLLLFCKSS
jgi:hypothetical protein